MIHTYDIPSQEHTEKLIGLYWKQYQDYLQALATSSFQNLVLPILKRRGWVMVVTNMDWEFGPAGKHQLYRQFDYDPTDPDQVTIVNLLILSVPGMPTEDFGMLMPSYGFPEYSNNYEEPEAPQPGPTFLQQLESQFGKTALYLNKKPLWGVVMHEAQAEDLDRVLLFDTEQLVELAMTQVEGALQTISYPRNSLVMNVIEGTIFVATANTGQLEPIASSKNYPWIEWDPNQIEFR